jgi:hypothetical protein
VPLAKIDKNHSYWDRSWGDLKIDVEATIETNEFRLKTLLGDVLNCKRKRDVLNYRKNIKYYERTVAKLKCTLEFLENGEISPYQLLNKEYTQSCKAMFQSQARLFIVADTLRQLSMFDIGIKPVQWLRHRLHELTQEEGKDFNFATTIDSFGNDKELSALLASHALKNPPIEVTDLQNPHTEVTDLEVSDSQNNQTYERRCKRIKRIHDPPERKWCCELCRDKRSFYRSDALRTHIQTYHNQETPRTRGRVKKPPTKGRS